MIKVKFKQTPHNITPGPRFLDSDQGEGGVSFCDENGTPGASFILREGSRFDPNNPIDKKNIEALTLYKEKYKESGFELVDEQTVNQLSIENELRVAALLTEVANLCKSPEQLESICVSLNIRGNDEKESLAAVIQACKINPDLVDKAIRSSDRNLLVTHRKASDKRIILMSDGRFTFNNGKEIVNLGPTEESAIDYYKLNTNVYKQILHKLNGHVVSEPVAEFTAVLEEKPVEQTKDNVIVEKKYNLPDLLKKALELSIFTETTNGFNYGEIYIGKQKTDLLKFLEGNKGIQKSIDERK